jgi:hypothetical protein
LEEGQLPFFFAYYDYYSGKYEGLNDKKKHDIFNLTLRKDFMSGVTYAAKRISVIAKKKYRNRKDSSDNAAGFTGLYHWLGLVF